MHIVEPGKIRARHLLPLITSHKGKRSLGKGKINRVSTTRTDCGDSVSYDEVKIDTGSEGAHRTHSACLLRIC